MRHDDRHLFDRLRAGDEQALEQLLSRHWDGLLRYAWSFLRDWDRAEDVTQGAYVRLWAERDRWRAESTVALLYRIVRNAALDARRSTARRSGPGALVAMEAGSAPDRALEATELERAAAAAVARLPERRGEVFRLAREEALSYAEIAEVMGLSVQTVANHMSLALSDLRAALRPLLDARDDTPETGGRGTEAGT